MLYLSGAPLISFGLILVIDMIFLKILQYFVNFILLYIMIKLFREKSCFL